MIYGLKPDWKSSHIALFSKKVHLQKFEYFEKGQYFLSLFSESESHPIYYIDSLHIGNYSKPLLVDILMIMAYR